MNYIHHMNEFYARAYSDERLHITHFGLYVALFQFWNLNRFQDPIKVNREEIMRLCCMGSKNTYSKCMKELHQWGYINYRPSFNPMVGSEVHLYRFDTGSGTCGEIGSGTTDGQPVGPYIKHNKQYKHIKQEDEKFKNYDKPL